MTQEHEDQVLRTREENDAEQEIVKLLSIPDDPELPTYKPKDLLESLASPQKKKRPLKKTKQRQAKPTLYLKGLFTTDEAVLEAFKKRVTTSNLDVGELFDPSNYSNLLEKKINAWISDLPYGVLPNSGDTDGVDIDPVWSEDLIQLVATGMFNCSEAKSVAVLGMGTCEQVTAWRKALKDAGWTLEKMPRVVTNKLSHEKSMAFAQQG
jgi:hypothetical protein